MTRRRPRRVLSLRWHAAGAGRELSARLIIVVVRARPMSRTPRPVWYIRRAFFTAITRLSDDLELA